MAPSSPRREQPPAHSTAKPSPTITPPPRRRPALAKAVAAAKTDPVVTAAFCLLVVTLLIKAAIVPFQFWLSDAHAVAPSPVSVIFSGAMVSVALYSVAILYRQVFVGDPAVDFAMHHLMLGMGAASGIIGDYVAWLVAGFAVMAAVLALA